MTFGEKLSELRKQRGMSQETLASELHVSRQAISRWELEEVVPDTVNVLALSKLLGVSTDYLLRDDCLEERDTPAAQKAEESIAIQGISKEYQRQKTNLYSPMDGSVRKPQQCLAEAGVIT